MLFEIYNLRNITYNTYSTKKQKKTDNMIKRFNKSIQTKIYVSV